jgi:hypothetical protein
MYHDVTTLPSKADLDAHPILFLSVSSHTLRLHGTVAQFRAPLKSSSAISYYFVAQSRVPIVCLMPKLVG